MKNKIKNYSFWVGLSGAVVVLVEAIGKAFGFIPDGQIASDIIMAIAGVLVIFGVVSMPTETNSNQNIEQNVEKENNKQNQDENKNKK